MGSKERMLQLLKSRVGQFISLRELGKAAKIVDYPRCMHEGKQAFFKEFDVDTMREITGLSSATARLREFIRRNYEKPLPVTMLAIVAESRDWTRQIRRFRQLGYFEYDYNRKDETYTFHSISLALK